MKKILFLPWVFCVLFCLGCETPGEKLIETAGKVTESKAKVLEGKKILTVIVNPTEIHVIADDGTSVTFYGYGYRNGGDFIRYRVGAR
jgi:hypothetical protein